MERLPTTVLYITVEMWKSVKARKQIAGFGILKGLILIMTISSSNVYKFLIYTNFMLCTDFLATWQTMRMNSYRKSRPCRDRERVRSAHCQASACVRGGADKSLVRPTSRCRRTESIVSLERGVCSCAELQVFSCYRGRKGACHATRAISTTTRRELSWFFFSCKAMRQRKFTPFSKKH